MANRWDELADFLGKLKDPPKVEVQIFVKAEDMGEPEFPVGLSGPKISVEVKEEEVPDDDEQWFDGALGLIEQKEETYGINNPTTEGKQSGGSPSSGLST